MAWTPTPPDQIPSPEALLDNLTREPGDPASGYITPDDVAEIVSAILSMVTYQGNLWGLFTGDVSNPVVAWDAATSYTADTVVTHVGMLWWNRTDTTPGEEPGVDGKWLNVDLPAVAAKARNAFGHAQDNETAIADLTARVTALEQAP